jgi:hypothetical protein
MIGKKGIYDILTDDIITKYPNIYLLKNDTYVTLKKCDEQGINQYPIVKFLVEKLSKSGISNSNIISYNKENIHLCFIYQITKKRGYHRKDKR